MIDVKENFLYNIFEMIYIIFITYAKLELKSRKRLVNQNNLLSINSTIIFLLLYKWEYVLIKFNSLKKNK